MLCNKVFRHCIVRTMEIGLKLLNGIDDNQRIHTVSSGLPYIFFHEEMSFSTHNWPPYNKGMMLGISRHIVTSSNLYLSAVLVANIFCQLNVFNSIYCSCDIKPLFEGTFFFVLTKMIQLNELCTMQVFCDWN